MMGPQIFTLAAPAAAPAPVAACPESPSAVSSRSAAPVASI